MSKTRQWVTTSACSTGDTVLVSAPVPGQSLVVVGYWILNQTSTANIYALGFLEGMTGASHFRDQSQNGGDRAALNFGQDWILGTGLSLGMRITQMGALNSTPSFAVTVWGYDDNRR